MKVDMRDAFFERLYEVASKDSRIMLLTADHGAFALEKFQKNLPTQYINVGIAEQNMVGVAAGLAMSGKIVFIYGISPFVSLRVLEQLTIDVSAMRLAVNVVSVGAGFTYSTDGPTHQGLQDISAISSIPGMTILNSSDPFNTSAFVDIVIEEQSPHYIRIEKEKLKNFPIVSAHENLTSSSFRIIHPGSNKNLVISTGFLSHVVLDSIAFIDSKIADCPTVIDLHRIFPLVDENLKSKILSFNRIVVAEENYFERGLYSILSTYLMKNNWKGELLSLGVQQLFEFCGSDRELLLQKHGLDKENIANFLLNIFSS
jgi:transketolase